MAAHQYPEGYAPNDWLVPTHDGHAIIRHGHDDPNDHTACGPTLFCCARSARLYAAAFPEVPETQATWQLMDKRVVLSWIDGGVNVAFFVFCDPESDRTLCALGISVAGGVREVIEKATPLEAFTEDATSLEVVPEDDVIFRLLRGR